jgi:MFS family permease
MSLSTFYVGYAIGSLIGGFLYHEVGGRVALKIFCAISCVCCVMHFVLYECSLKHTMLLTGKFLQCNICWEQLYLEKFRVCRSMHLHTFK